MIAVGEMGRKRMAQGERRNTKKVQKLFQTVEILPSWALRETHIQIVRNNLIIKYHILYFFIDKENMDWGRF